MACSSALATQCELANIRTHSTLFKNRYLHREAQPSCFSRKMAKPENPKEAIG